MGADLSSFFDAEWDLEETTKPYNVANMLPREADEKENEMRCYNCPTMRQTIPVFLYVLGIGVISVYSCEPCRLAYLRSKR